MILRPDYAAAVSMAEDQAEYLVWRDYLAAVPFRLTADVLSARRLMDEALEAIVQSVGVPAHLYWGSP